ncbi:MULTISPECIES: SAM-dependent methyltransferase [Pseudomonadati]|uniref:SAM-dependent methyltransferase n=1 Tax=unclassified Halobacteriovorax TaxID=2639665 RepID=UPI000CD0FCE1|nr:cyclopropane-fatty-acyl-phospholipid synthase family protein [Halobacteriovorax sp. DA5]POB13470.1 SAM-dependent methyltransferase [Halobacteriovorax sp. DA5]
MSILMNAAERGYIPDPLIRMGIRKLIKQRKDEINKNLEFHKSGIINDFNKSLIAEDVDKANEQHYELPPEFFKLVLGANLKYSSALFDNGITSLDEAESAMLEKYCERAQIVDGMDILELGCGWGSLSLFLARKFPNSKITAISNSNGQREFIEERIKERSLNNLEIKTCDINDFNIENKFDRIVSIEMFEHMRNYNSLFKKVASWLKDDGRLFIHIFCHKDASYFFETQGEDNWMGRYFFTGGVMPSFDLFEKVQDSFKLVEKWKVNGANYQETSEQWFLNMEKKRSEIMKVMANTYGEDQANIWFHRWKIFFASCAELFGYDNGEEWFVGHFLFEKK